MKRLFLILITLCMLVGCHEVKDIDEAVDNTLSVLAQSDMALRTNHSKDYYAYYLPNDIANIESGSTYNILEVSGNKIIVSLDISSIITAAYYSEEEAVESVYDLDDAIYQRSATLKDSAYDLVIYPYGDRYLVMLDINNVDIVALLNKNSLDNVIYDMFIVGLSIKTNNELVINDFSSKDVIDYHQEAIDLFEIVIPKDGRLEELLKPNQNVVK